MRGARTVSRETFHSFKIGEEIHWDRGQTHDASVTSLVWIWQAGIRISFSLKTTERADDCGSNVEASPGAAEIAMVGPLAVTTHLVNRIEPSLFDKTGG